MNVKFTLILLPNTHMHTVAPSINFTSPETIVTIQTSSSVSCPASGTPPPQIRWLYNGAAIEGVSGFDIDPESGDLLLSNPIPNQEGTLTCVASNSVGMTSASVELLVRGEILSDLILESSIQLYRTKLSKFADHMYCTPSHVHFVHLW